MLHDVVEHQGRLQSRVRHVAVPMKESFRKSHLLCEVWEVKRDQLAVVDQAANIFIHDLSSNTSRQL